MLKEELEKRCNELEIENKNLKEYQYKLADLRVKVENYEELILEQQIEISRLKKELDREKQFNELNCNTISSLKREIDTLKFTLENR